MKAVPVLLAFALASTITMNARAANDAPGVIRTYTDVVAPAEQAAYEAGIKSYNQCLAQHGFKYAWTAWTHETGDTYSYTYTTDPLPAAAFDALSQQAKACDDTLRTAINPHLKSETSAFIQPIAALSHLPKDNASHHAFAEVNYYKLKNGHEAQETFADVMHKISAAADKTKWNYYYAISAQAYTGGTDPEFIMVVADDHWADVGKMPDVPMWKMVEQVYGKDEALAMRKSLNDAVQYETVHIERVSDELTYRPASK
ncbi:hypothetical protein [Dyella sp. C11]|uniref:hypothetical protein n=1 Tax=Dyella sp. C11 TaxID=2126991 RepID=UPI000D643CD1|nr:hypothetical protein [Dyella sp. C11]